MIWRRPSLTAAVAHAPAPVPDGEATRRAALQASWRRGRSVARRRLAWRWTLWFVLRGLLPALLLAGAAALAWRWLYGPAIEPVQPVANPVQRPVPASGETGVSLRIDSQLQGPTGAISAAVPSTPLETLGPNGPPTPLKP